MIRRPEMVAPIDRIMRDIASPPAGKRCRRSADRISGLYRLSNTSTVRITRPMAVHISGGISASNRRPVDPGMGAFSDSIGGNVAKGLYVVSHGSYLKFSYRKLDEDFA
jgi:hypothetical protein